MRLSEPRERMMAFDPVDYVPPQSPPPRRKAPRLSPSAERMILLVLGILAAMLFVLPFSAATLIDIVRYLGG